MIYKVEKHFDKIIDNQDVAPKDFIKFVTRNVFVKIFNGVQNSIVLKIFKE